MKDLTPVNCLHDWVTQHDAEGRCHIVCVKCSKEYQRRGKV